MDSTSSFRTGGLGRLERFVNRRVENRPPLKRALKDAYHLLMRPLPAQDVVPESRLKVFPGHFFGFHDTCPWSPDGRLLLAHRVRSDRTWGLDRAGAPRRCEVGCLDARRGYAFRRLGSTSAWNWQEGARLQWVGGGAAIWNEFREGCLVSVRRRPAGADDDEVLGPPIHAVSASGRLATVICYARIARWSQAYSYLGLPPPSADAPGELGLYDLASEVVRPLAGIDRVAALDPQPTMAGAPHYFSHTSFAPDERRCAFMHCWLVGERRYSRLVVCDLASGALQVLPCNGWVSHYCWHGPDAVIAFDEDAAAARGYRRFDLVAGTIVPIGLGRLLVDGHPQVSPDGRWLLTDSYPNRHMQQDIILYDLRDEVRHVLLRARVPFRYRYDQRCDFHPRWNRDGTAICFDSAHLRRRALCVLEGPLEMVRG